MSVVNAYEQYILEIINAERVKVGVQPLAFDGSLNNAAEGHSTWMDETDSLTHAGAGDSSPYDRMVDAGYDFSGTYWAYGENIAGLSLRSPSGYEDEIDIVHSFFMGSSAHRANILNDTFKEIGVGFTVGHYTNYDSIFITQDFAATATNPFLTGVAFDDQDGDKRYDINEGLGSFTVSAQNNTTGAIFTTQTGYAGGYTLELASGNYTITFSGNGFNTQTQQVSIGSKNVKLDLIDSTLSTDTSTGTNTDTSTDTGADKSTDTSTDTNTTESSDPTTTESEPSQNIISGGAGHDRLIGTSNDDVISGSDGHDKLYGNAGNDQLYGGDGHDTLSGGSGADILTGDSGRDNFVFDVAIINDVIDTIVDFSPKHDTIHLDNSIFSGLDTGRISTAAFYSGTAAQDANDRIIYNAQTGDLYYDADGSGSASAQQFAVLSAGLELDHTDFYIF